MVSSRKQWRRLALGLMLTWALLFLALLSYFMESRVDEPHSSAPLSHADARRLASVQGNPRAIVVQQERATGAPDPSGSGSPRQDRNPQWVPSEEPPPVPRLGPEAYPDPRSPAAWSAFGARDEAADSAGATRELGGARGPRPEADGARRAGEEEEEEGGEDEGGEEAEEDRLPGTTTRRAEDSDDLEDYYFSKAKAVMQRLWRGSLSVGMLSPRLQRAMKDYLNSNKHGVAYRGRRRGQQSGRQVLCELKRRGRVQTVDGAEPPFSELGWAGLVPSARLTELYGSGFGSCAVVTSAGAILLSALGKEIDSHDAVLRFNAAPTEGYERDVGNKTTIRIINSQILANPKHLFNTSSLYKNVTLVAWDPAPYTVNLNKWFSSPDYNLFSPYVAHRKSFPDQPFYILHPRFIWQLWDVIQGNTLDNIQPNPPSSGFIGILLMMSLCEEVHVYEYIPSLRQTDLCHYHERYYDAACTLGAYHPLLYEKMLVQRMNQGSESDLKRKGKVTLPGFSTIHCDP